MKRMITKNQIRAVRTLASRRFGDDGDYRDFLQSNFGVKSTLELTFQEASQVIVLLGRDLPRPTPSSVSPPSREETKYRGRYIGAGMRGSVGGWLTQAQADEIARMENVLGWTDQPERLAGWIRKMTGLWFHVDMIKPGTELKLRNYQARKVIAGMRALIEKTISTSDVHSRALIKEEYHEKAVQVDRNGWKNIGQVQTADN